MLQSFQKSILNRYLGEPQQYIENFTLLGSPLPILTISFVYLMFVLKWGPAYMKERSAYNMHYFIIIYNAAQILSNLYITFVGTYFMVRYSAGDMGCCASLPNDHQKKSIEIRFHYVFFIVRIFDLLDTIVYVLRKSFKQVTFLHVYHHLVVVNLLYLYYHQHGFGGQIISIILLNSTVHSIMYAYYLLAALHVPYARTIKMHITRMQLIQFALIMMHFAYPLIWRPDCKFPRFWLHFVVWHSVLFIVLFGNFYWKAYLQKRKQKESNIVDGSAMNGKSHLTNLKNE